LLFLLLGIQAILTENSAHVAALEESHQNEVDTLSKSVFELKQVLSKQRDSYKAQLKKMQDKLDNQSDGNSVATDDMSLDDMASMDSSFADIQSGADESCVSPGMGGDNKSSGGGGRGRSQDVSRKYKKRLRRVMKELTTCHEQCEVKDTELARLSDKLSVALQEVSASHRKLDALRESNEGLRYHMQRCTGEICGLTAVESGRVEFTKFSAERVVQQENLNILQHSPHFLHHSRHQLKMKSLGKIQGTLL
jgi:chromosome segregation ATPase